MDKPRQKFKKFILFLGDIFLLYLSLYIALALRNLSIFDEKILQLFKGHIIPFSPIIIIWIIIFIVFDLYNPKFFKDINFYKNIVIATLISFSTSVIIFYINPPAGITPKTVLLIYTLTFITLFTLWRYFYSKTISPKIFSRNIVLLGDTQETEELISTIEAIPQLGYKIIIHYPHVDFGIQNVQNEIKNKDVHLVVIPDDININNESLKILYESIFLNVDFIHFSSFYEFIIKRMPLSTINENWFLKNISANPNQINDSIKRVLDTAIASIGFAASAIIYPIIILAIKLDSRGPAFITQKRIGQNNKIFNNIKFRSMLVNDGGKWPEKNDKRITRVGRFLRKTRIDELPQLINVIRGDISLVGPRPDIIDLYEKLESEIPYYKIRNLIKPGLTGWAQIHQESPPHSVESTKQRLSYDFYYLKNRSFILDLMIILRTIKTLLSQKGS